MKRYLYALRYLISIHVLGLILFTAFRLILFLQGYEYLMDEEISVFTRLEAFVRGLWLDNVVASYISILPLVIVSLCSLIGYFGKNLYRGIHIFFSVFYVVAFAISAADIPYFAYFFKHINASIFNWFGYTGTTLGLMFGEFSYIVAFVLFLCLSFLFVFLSRILLHRTCRDIQRVSAEKFHWKPELLTLLCSTLLIGVCLFGIRGRMGYNPIKVSAAYYCNNTFRSLCFNRFFSAGTHTNHAIHSVLYSYPALMKRNSMKGAVIPFFAGLPTILQDNGYRTLFFMTHESQYDNMNGYLRTNGFDRIFAQEDYPKDKVVNSFGVQDDFLYQYALPILTETANEGQPFFAVLLSISNHPPYVIPKDFKTHSNTDEHRIVEFADHALKEFIDKAKQQEWFDNTIFVFVGDHGKIVGTPRSDMPLSFNHVPLFIYSPSFIEPRQIEDLGGQVDIAPTVLGLLNIDYTDNGFGVNLLQEKRKAAFFTSDDAIGCVNDSLFYIYKPKENQEWLLSQERAIEKGGNIDNPAVCQELREYAFSMLQTAQYLMSNNLTGKYIGYQPR